MANQMDYPEELAQQDEHFASGVNAPGEVRGLALSGRHVGITATEIRDGLLEELAIGTHGLSRLFVDSGAFSEVKFGPEGMKVVKEITDAEWQRRFQTYRWAAATYRRRAYLVAPDRVGCQPTTLARLERYAAEMQVCATAGANIIVPVQKGALAMSEMWRRACELLGLRGLIAGIPMKKDATSLEDLAELAASLPQDARFHLLGLGPESPRFAAVIALIKSHCPQAQITSDSVTIRRLVGRKNGRGGGPRALTAAQDRARAMGITDVQEVKASGLIHQGFQEIDADRKRAHDLGWFDAELYDSAEEAQAHHREMHPELYAEPVKPAKKPAKAAEPMLALALAPGSIDFDSMSLRQLQAEVLRMFGVKTSISNESTLRYKLRRGERQIAAGEAPRFSVDSKAKKAVSAPPPPSSPQLSLVPAPPRRKKVLSLGGGLDSWAMLLDAELRGEIPDVVAFIDVGDAENRDEHPGEWEGTYRHIEEVVKPWCAARGIEYVEISARTGYLIRPDAKRARVKGARSLFQWLWDMDQIPVAGPDRMCTGIAKVERFERWLDDRFAGQEVEVWIGFDASEGKRIANDVTNGKPRGPRLGAALKAKKPTSAQVLKASWRWTKALAWAMTHACRINRFPLMEREFCRCRCEKLARESGLPVPRKSACMGCCYNTPGDWKVVAVQVPTVFDKYVAMEDKKPLTKENGRKLTIARYDSRTQTGIPLAVVVQKPYKPQVKPCSVCGAAERATKAVGCGFLDDGSEAAA